MTSSDDKGQPTPYSVLAALRAQYPDSPFIALGQTVFWDEPMKAVLRRLLDTQELGGEMLVGVHDTDYFAKLGRVQSGNKRFALMAHNDGTTRDLWSAAGEISTLFGSETFPQKDKFIEYGVPFERVVRASGEDRQKFIDQITEAWGWRGLVYTGSRDLIVSQLPLKEVGDGVFEMLTWGFQNAISQIVQGCCQEEAEQVANMILTWCHDYRSTHPQNSLSDLYQFVLPQLYSLILGHSPQNLTVGSTSKVLRLTPETAGLPRFKFVDIFLNPATRQIALDAYNQAVAGSEIYTLDKFGAGALPFDVIVPERGRGTLRITPRVLFVETRNPIAIGLKKPIASIHDVAKILHAKFGDDVVLVGKAVSLVSMLAQEFIFVFHEEGSMYVHRTRKMNDILRKQGVPIEMRPILRMRYQTWDSLACGRSTLRPVEHLAATFGQQTITTPEFAASWRQVIIQQRELCKTLATVKKPRTLMEFLSEQQPAEPWDDRLTAYDATRDAMSRLWRQGEAIKRGIEARYTQWAELKAHSEQTQIKRGAHYRSIAEWGPVEEAQRKQYAQTLKQLNSEKAHLKAEIAELKEQRRGIERGAEMTHLRATLRELEDAAETARLHLVRNALLTIESLEHTNHRPSAWWLPMLDGSGEWFNRIAATTELYTEPLMTD